jgi:hypothetical protein
MVSVLQRDTLSPVVSLYIKIPFVLCHRGTYDNAHMDRRDPIAGRGIDVHTMLDLEAYKTKCWSTHGQIKEDAPVARCGNDVPATF